jgi:hypothetical protein
VRDRVRGKGSRGTGLRGRLRRRRHGSQNTGMAERVKPRSREAVRHFPQGFTRDDSPGPAVKMNGRYVTIDGMTELLEKAIAKVREFPDEDQDAFAVALLSMAGEETPIIHLDEETRAAVRDGLAQAKRDEFVPEEEMEAFFKQHDL